MPGVHPAANDRIESIVGSGISNGQRHQALSPEVVRSWEWTPGIKNPGVKDQFNYKQRAEPFIIKQLSRLNFAYGVNCACSLCA